jgi:protein-L-isoaspartate(D-aspartate) O-methyltransferase
VLSRVAAEVFGVEVHAALVNLARERLQALGYDNVSILYGDGTQGWPEHAPFDAILVSAGGPVVPESLLNQLKIGGRLVIPVGDEPRAQELLRIQRTGEHTFDRSSLGKVQFVPLVGTEGWSLDGMPVAPHRDRRPLRITRPQRDQLAASIRRNCEPFDDLTAADLQPLLQRIATAKIVLIGEASHGTSEFYRMRARITRELITQPNAASTSWRSRETGRMFAPLTATFVSWRPSPCGQTRSRVSQPGCGVIERPVSLWSGSLITTAALVRRNDRSVSTV